MNQLLCFYFLVIEVSISTMSGPPCQETTILYGHFLTAAQDLELLRVWGFKYSADNNECE